MAESRHGYSCKQATTRVVSLFTALGEHHLLTFTPERALLEGTVRRCASCDRGRAAKHCTGWVTKVDPTIATFAPVKVKGGCQVQPALYCTISYTRSKPAVSSQWRDTPMATCDLALHILDLSGRLLERHHIDLANRHQEGPTWHLQYGGNPPDHPKPETHWLDPPRWAVPPFDLALMLETVAFNFYYDKWRDLNEHGEWLRAVKAAEDLSIRHYAERLSAHFLRKPDDRSETWLAMQDNAIWDPRPS